MAFPKALLVSLCLSLLGCGGSAPTTPGQPSPSNNPFGPFVDGSGEPAPTDGAESAPNGNGTGTPTAPQPPTPNGFFASVEIEQFNSVRVPSDGDLWPSCWSNDDALYTANGDGWGFDNANRVFGDIKVARVNGLPTTGITGVSLAAGDQIARIWGDGRFYNRKPTGMVCVDGKLYLAVQDLNLDFNDAPVATIVMSADKGRTWSGNRTTAMFPNQIFTTIWFLDYGKDNALAKDNYVYAYGLDRNWRDSFNDRVPDPTAVFLARVPKTAIQDRAQWEFFTGLDLANQATWNRDIAQKKPVLEEKTRVYNFPSITGPNGALKAMTIPSQGSVVYNAPLNRYIYSAWTEFSFDLYESPTPWGPWRKFATKDFGRYPWFADRHGGYSTTTPSKYISADGKTMWILSATFMGAFRDYAFSMRKVTLEPYVYSEGTNAKSPAVLNGPGSGAVPFVKTLHFGTRGLLSNGVVGTENEDSWNGELNPEDWWGYTFPKALHFNKLVYSTGKAFPDGGWFTSLRVEVRRNFVWMPVEAMVSTPAYPLDASAAGHKTFTFTFKETWGDGIRVVGVPGGPQRFTSISELAAYYE